MHVSGITAILLLLTRKPLWQGCFIQLQNFEFSGSDDPGLGSLEQISKTMTHVFHHFYKIQVRCKKEGKGYTHLTCFTAVCLSLYIHMHAYCSSFSHIMDCDLEKPQDMMLDVFA